MKITLSTIIVDDQSKALAFYTGTLGFVEKVNIPMGPVSWITLASPEQPDGAQISLEPAGFPFVQEYQRALKDNGVPLTAFAVADVQAEHDRLTAAGVAFKSPPRKGEGTTPTTAMFDDRCGNWIMIYEDAK